jgi:hypothetical protein
MFRLLLPPIIRSAFNCIYSIWYLSDRYCYLPLSWDSWNWFECAVGGVRTRSELLVAHEKHEKLLLLTVYVVSVSFVIFCAPVFPLN